MVTYTYKDFKELESCPYIGEDHDQIIGQGLTKAYNITCSGTGKCRYTIVFDYNGQEYTFQTKDKFILEWRTKYCGEEDVALAQALQDDFSFEAYGLLKKTDERYGKLIYIYHGNNFDEIIDDYKLINCENTDCQIKKIVVELKDKYKDLKPPQYIKDIYKPKTNSLKQCTINDFIDADNDQLFYLKSSITQKYIAKVKKPNNLIIKRKEWKTVVQGQIDINIFNEYRGLMYVKIECFIDDGQLEDEVELIAKEEDYEEFCYIYK